MDFRLMKSLSMKFTVLLFFICFQSILGIAQYNAGGTQFYIGPRISLNAAKYTPGKNIPGIPESYKAKPGYGAGFMYKFRITDLISLHGEMNYSRKTRSVIDSTIITEFRNHHLDVPILFELSFPAKIKKIGSVEYFFNAGPQMSYWLSGEGKTEVMNTPENLSNNYDIKFNAANNQALDSELNRLQYGFIFGVGLTLPSVGDNFFVIEARYFFCQTYLGEKYSTNLDDFTYEDDLRGNYQTLSLSFAYTFGLNFMSKSQKKAGMKVKTVIK